ncbi:MAG: hypothetical protein LBB94_01050 [Clostridiales bacterium]|jgi:hypothetical protein|nr:hypothetical protein [Clostridiales bacterium]
MNKPTIIVMATFGFVGLLFLIIWVLNFPDNAPQASPPQAYTAGAAEDAAQVRETETPPATVTPPAESALMSEASARLTFADVKYDTNAHYVSGTVRSVNGEGFDPLRFRVILFIYKRYYTVRGRVVSSDPNFSPDGYRVILWIFVDYQYYCKPAWESDRGRHEAFTYYVCYSPESVRETAKGLSRNG